MFCSNCGNKLPDNAKFCTECGAKIASTESMPTQEAASSFTVEPTASTPQYHQGAKQKESAPQPQSLEDYASMPIGPETQAILDKMEAENKQKTENEQAEEPEQEKKKKKIGMGVLIGIISCSIFGVVFLVGFILAFAADSNVGNVILIISGAIEIGASVVLYKVADHRMKVTCPCCGTKRPHKRVWVQTDEKYSSTSSTQKITYTHRYIDYYICPNCGETFKQNIKKNGGYIDDNGDHRIPVREIL